MLREAAGAVVLFAALLDRFRSKLFAALSEQRCSVLLTRMDELDELCALRLALLEPALLGSAPCDGFSQCDAAQTVQAQSRSSLEPPGAVERRFHELECVEGRCRVQLGARAERRYYPISNTSAHQNCPRASQRHDGPRSALAARRGSHLFISDGLSASCNNPAGRADFKR